MHFTLPNKVTVHYPKIMPVAAFDLTTQAATNTIYYGKCATNTIYYGKCATNNFFA